MKPLTDILGAPVPSDARTEPTARPALQNLLQESAVGALALMDPDAGFRELNREMEVLFGYRSAELEGEMPGLLLAPEAQHQWIPLLKRAIAEEAAEATLLMQDRAGRRFTASVDVHTVPQAGETWLLWRFRDLAVGISTSLAGMGSPQAWQAFAEALPAGLLLTRGNQVILSNTAVLKVLALDGQPIRSAQAKWETLGAEWGQLTRWQSELAQDARQVRQAEIALPQQRTVEVYSAPFTQGRESLRLWLLREVSQQHRQVEELRKTAAEVEQLNRDLLQSNQQLQKAVDRANATALEAEQASATKSAFLASMSHEIRTPMTGVIGMATMLDESELTDEQRDWVRTIRSSGEALLNIINDLLDFSKIEAGHIEIEAIPVDLVQLVEESLDIVSPQLGTKPVELMYELENGTPRHIRSDPTRLRQILVNLLGNAVKFTSQGEICARLKIIDRQGNDLVLQLTVSDTGIGIPRERLPQLFQAYKQADASVSRQYGGTGLGLAICRRLAELMGGEVGVDSVLGEGSDFRVTFRTQEIPQTAEQPPIELRGKTALVVVANASSRHNLVKRLQRVGVQAEEAASLSTALKVLARQRPQLLLVEQAQLRPEPTKTVEQLRSAAREPELPIVVLTNLDSRGTPGDRLDDPLAWTLTKPIRQDILVRHLRAALKTAHSPADAVLPPSGEALVPEQALSILLADDNPVNQKVGQLLLRRLGHTADVAANGREVMAALQRRTYDVILMDVQMPEMDGLEATRQIRAQVPLDRQPQIVAMTAGATQEDREDCFSSGMNAFVSKPVRLQDLREVLSAIIPRGAEPTGYPEIEGA